MKKGLHKFTLTKTLIDKYEDRYHNLNMFLVVNGALLDEYYKPYRDIQVSIIKQIVEKQEHKFSRELVNINMDVTYESDELSITWNSWLPEIKIEDKLNHKSITIILEREQLHNNIELLVF